MLPAGLRPKSLETSSVSVLVNFVTTLRAGGGLQKQAKAGDWRKRREKGQERGEMSKRQVKVQQGAEATLRLESRAAVLSRGRFKGGQGLEAVTPPSAPSRFQCFPAFLGLAG